MGVGHTTLWGGRIHLSICVQDYGLLKCLLCMCESRAPGGREIVRGIMRGNGRGSGRGKTRLRLTDGSLPSVLSVITLWH